MTNSFLNFALRPWRVHKLIAALAIFAGLCGGGNTNAQSLSAATAGVATAHDVVSFSDLAPNSDATAAPAAQPTIQPTLRNSKRAFPGVNYKPSHNAAIPLRAATTTSSATLSSPSSISTSPLKTASLAPASLVTTSSFSATAFSPTSSPPASASFLSLLGDGTAFTPDSAGAVGPNHMMTVVNSQIRVQDKQGGQISTVSLDSFWTGLRTPNPSVSDPRVLYEPYGNRFIFAAVGDQSRTNSILLLAVSQSNNPTGNWNRYAVDVGNTNPKVFADSPNVGFNKDWIVVQIDTYLRTNIPSLQLTNGDFYIGDVYVFDKTNLYAGGSGIRTRIPMTNAVDGVLGYAQVPAMMYDTNLSHIFLMNNYGGNSSGVGYMRIFTITGAVNAPFLIDDQNYGFDPAISWEDFPPDNFGPQLGSTTGIQTGDARLHTVIYRNSSLWTTHTTYHPLGTPTTSEVVYWEIFPGDGTPLQRAVVSDPSGQVIRAYPTMAVNLRNDILLAYSIFSRGAYAGAGYSFRSGGSPAVGIPEDVLGTLRSEIILKPGEAPYLRTNSHGVNLWGRRSATMLDPANDTEFWTLQEFAATPSGATNLWGTWWGRVSPMVSLTLRMTNSPSSVPAGGNVTYTLTVTNNFQFRTDGATGDGGVRIIDPIPATANFVSASSSQGACGVSNNIVICNLGMIRDGTEAGATIVLSPSVTGLFTNTATVSANGPDLETSDNTVAVSTTVVPSANLAVSISDSPDPVTISSNLTYSIAVANLGPSAANGVNLTNTLPASATFVSVQSSIGVCSRNGNIVSCNLGTITANNSAAITIVTTPTTSGTISNTVAVTASTADPNTANNSATVSTRVNAKPTISAIANQPIPEDTTLGPISFTVADAETPSTSLLVTASSSNTNLVPNANIVLGGSGSSRSVTITPAANQFGNCTISLTVTDADGATALSSFTLTISPVNDPPTLDPIANITVDEDTPATVPLTGISSGAPNEGQVLVITASSANTGLIPNPTVSYSSPNPSGTLTFTPVANLSGSTTVTVTINDGGASNNIVTRTFTVTVNPVNDPPTLDPIRNLIIAEDSPAQFVNLTGISSGAPNESQTLVVTAASSDSTIIPNPNVTYSSPNPGGSLAFTPVPNAFGTATITVTVNDGGGANNIATRTFTVTVNAINDTPTLAAINDLSIAEDSGLQTVSLTGIGSGAANENQTLSISALSSDTSIVPHPTINYSSPNPTGSLSFTPATNAFGTATITVTLDDGGSSNNIVTRTFNVTVNPVNDPPGLDPIGDLSIVEDSGVQMVTLTGINAGAPNESQPLTVTAVSSDTTIIPNPSVSYTSPNATGSLSFTPLANAAGVATITVRLNDGAASNNITTRTFTVTVNAVNDPPTLDPIADVSLPEDSGPQNVNLSGITSGAFNENQVLSITVSATDPTIVGNLFVNYTSPATSGFLTFTPAPDAFGTAIVSVRLDDGGESNNIVSRSFSVTVAPVNDPPTVAAISDVEVDEDSGSHSLILSGIGSGAINENQTLTLSAVSSNPSLIPNPVIAYSSPAPTATLTFVSITNQSGVALITVTVNDNGASNNIFSRSFSVRVNPVNDLPAISAIGDALTPEDTPITVPFVVGDVETPADALTLQANSSNEELISSTDVIFGGSGSNRTVIITPLTNQFGSATITITVIDADGGTASTSFGLDVDPVNDPPAISTIPPQALDENTSLGAVPFTISDPESDPDDLTLSVFSSSQTLLPNANLVLSGSGQNRSLRITPALTKYGTATVSVVARDPAGASSTNSFLVTVRHINHMPIISAIGPQTILEDTPTAPIVVTVGDDETVADDLTLTGFSSNPSIVSAVNFQFSGSGSNRLVTVRPATNQNGLVLVTVVVHDTDGGAASNSFTLNITPVNDLPVISGISNQVVQENGFTLVNFNVADIETASGALIVSASAANKDLVPDAGLALGGTDANRTLTITPAPNQFGSTTITLQASDADGGSVSTSFGLVINAAPVLLLPGPQTIAEDAVAGPIGLTVGDIETPAQNLTLTASSSDPSIVPNANLTFGGTGSNRFLFVQPATNQNGSVLITVVVHDADGGAASNSFTLNITPVNDLPVIGAISSQVTDEDVIKIVNLTIGDVETSAGSLTVNGTSSDTGLVPNSNLVFGGSGANRTLSITPAANQSGSTTITLTVADADGGTVSSSFLLVVNPINDPPTLDPIANLVIDEDSGPRTVNLSGISSGAPNETQVLNVSATSSDPSIIPNPVVSYFSPETTGALTFNPATNANGVVTITVTVNDGGASNNVLSRTFQVTVNPVNDPPTISSIADQGMDEDTVLGPISFTVADLESVSNLMITGSSSNTGLVANAGIALGGSGSSRTVTVTPLSNQSGSTVITLTVSDPQGASASTSFKLTVNPINDAPTISTIANQTIAEDGSTAALALVVGDVESAAATLVVSARSSNQQLLPDSNLVLSGTDSNRTIRLTPATNQSGSATVTLTVRDPEGLSANTSFVLTVTPVNDSPTIGTIGNQTINEDSVLSLPLTLADPDSAPISLVLSATSSNPVLVPNTNIVFSGSGFSRSLQITPATNENGSATITVTVSDGISNASTSFVLTVAPVNDPPTLNPISNITLNEDAALQTVPLGGIGSGAANESQPLSVTAISSNPTLIPNPTVSYTSPATNGSLSFTPIAAANGSAVITVTVSDGSAQASRSFTVTVNPVNDGPTIAAIANQSTLEDTPITIPFIINDIDTTALLLNVTAVSSNQTIVPTTNIVVSGFGTNRTVTITPAPDQSGTAAIRLTVSDGVTNASTFFNLTVNAVNDPPTINPIANQNVTVSPGTLTVSLSGITSGATNETQTLTVTASSSNTSLVPTPTVTYTSPNSTGSLSYRPANNVTGTSVITVSVSDGQATNKTIFLVNVRPNANANPTISSITNRTVSEDTIVGPISFTIADSVTPATLLTLASASSNPVLVPTNNIVFGGSAGNRTVTITPAADQSGVATITISVTDTNFGSVSTNFVLTVTPLNDPPTISPIPSQTIAEDTVSAPIVFMVNDVDTPMSNLVVTAASSNPTLIPNSNILLGGNGTNRAVVLTPATNQFGVSTITLTVSDGSTNSSTFFVLTVNPINDLPTLAAIPDQITTEDTPTAPIALTVGDVETSAASLSLSANSSNPALVSSFTFGGSGANRTLVITPAPNQNGNATITVTLIDTDGGVTNTSFALTITPANDPPTLDPINNLLVNEGAGVQTVNLTGISSGALNENQTLALTATSSNPDLIPNPALSYTSPNATGTLSLAPVFGTNGSALITVTVNDGQSQSNTLSRTFTVTVNDRPTISPIADQVIAEDTVSGPLSFTVGDRDTPASNLVVSATSSNPALIPDANILLDPGASNRTLRLTPLANQFGYATITLSATDSNNLTGTRSFALIVSPVNDAPTLDTLPDLLINEDAGVQTVNLTGITSGALNENQSLTVRASSSHPALIADPIVSYTSPNSSGNLTFAPLPNASGTAVISVSVNDGGSQNNHLTRTFTVTVSPVNDPPTLDPIHDIVIAQDVPATVSLTGITAGPNEIQPLTVTATSSNPGLIPNPLVTYSNPDSAGTLSLTPASNAIGSAAVTVTVNDGDTLNDTITRTFVVTVSPINHPPTFDPIADLVLNEDSGLHTVTLTGISSGATNEAQLLNLSVVNGNPALLTSLSIDYHSPAATGTLSFGTVRNASGTAIITVTADDGGGSNNISRRGFAVTINPVNDAPTLDAINDIVVDQNSGSRTVMLTGIGSGAANENQTLTLNAVSSDTTVIPTPAIAYLSPGSNAALTFTPNTGTTGNVVITVTVHDDGGTANGGQDSITRTFGITVRPPVSNTNTPPFLRIDRVGAKVVLSWPADATDFELQSRSAFVPSSLWSGVADVPLIVGGRCFVTNTPTGQARFYQLGKKTVVTNAAPTLRIELVGNNVVISWPTNAAAGYVLQSKTIFDSASVWAPVAELPVLSGNRFYVTNSPPGNAWFYQLAKIPAAPRLQISKSGDNVVVSWPLSAAGYILESSWELSPTARWTEILGPPSASGSIQSITVLNNKTARFFRLRSP